MRKLIGALGILVGGYGAWLLLSRTDNDQLFEAGTWLLAGVVLHDFVLTAAILVVAGLVVRVLPEPATAPTIVGLIVLGSLTIVAFPVLGRFGAREDNPTLLDRPYLASWLVVAGVTVLAVVAVSLVRSRRGPGPRRGE